MSQFIDECRREWKRLRVPPTIADEMADDLTADLAEAEAEGASPEDVLGRGASDPRAFAAAWASERGIVRPPRRSWIRRWWILAVAAILLILGLFVVGTIAVFTSSSPSSAPHAAVVEPTAFVPLRRQINGTAIVAARLPPSKLVVSTARPDVVHRRPSVLEITFANSGSADIAGPVVVVIRVNQHTYLRRVSHVTPRTVRMVLVALPHNLPPHLTITAWTRPVPGEINMTNNRQTWHVIIRK